MQLVTKCCDEVPFLYLCEYCPQFLDYSFALIYIIPFQFQVPLLEKGDIIIDGGNSEYRDTNVSQKKKIKKNYL